MNQLENSNWDNLYSRSGLHVVSKAFSISKNTGAVDILLLKFWWRDQPDSYIEVLYCDLRENLTDLCLVSFFPRCVFGLFCQLICWTESQRCALNTVNLIADDFVNSVSNEVITNAI
jgi:hypothetical protein